MGVEGWQGERSKGAGGGLAKVPRPREEPGVSHSPLTGGCQPGPHAASPPAAAPGEARPAPSGSPAEPGGGGLGARGGGGALCACVSGPYLFSPPLILVPPAAPHTKPHSPNPQGAGKGGQRYSAALLGASEPSSSAGWSQHCWPCTGHCLRSALERVLASFPSQAPFLSTALCLWVPGGGHALAAALGP